jgi:hypothetical protein
MKVISFSRFPGIRLAGSTGEERLLRYKSGSGSAPLCGGHDESCESAPSHQARRIAAGTFSGRISIAPEVPDNKHEFIKQDTARDILIQKTTFEIQILFIRNIKTQ